MYLQAVAQVYTGSRYVRGNTESEMTPIDREVNKFRDDRCGRRHNEVGQGWTTEHATRVQNVRETGQKLRCSEDSGHHWHFQVHKYAG